MSPQHHHLDLDLKENPAARSSDDYSDDIELSSVDEEHEDLLPAEKDVEAQTAAADQDSQTPVEYSIPTARKLIFLALYFFLNLGLTLSNKALLQKASYPWMLTFSHTFSTSIGCLILLATGRLKLSQLSWRDNLILLAFSVLFTLNIAISNVSLALVSIPFHQIMRSTCPVITVLIYRFVYSRTYSAETYLTLIPLVVGVGLATFGSYYFTVIGFLLTFLGVLLASIKTVATNRLMTGTLKLSAMEALFRMSPLAAVQCLLYAGGSGELSRMWTGVSGGQFSVYLLLGIVGNASLAFALNLTSFQTNKVAGALTMSVCGNVKQCLTILLGIVLFNVQIGVVNGVGMLIAILGASLYSKVELDRKKATST